MSIQSLRLGWKGLDGLDMVVPSDYNGIKFCLIRHVAL
jgi:hypothetical protein